MSKNVLIRIDANSYLFKKEADNWSSLTQDLDSILQSKDISAVNRIFFRSILLISKLILEFPWCLDLKSYRVDAKQFGKIVYSRLISFHAQFEQPKMFLKGFASR